MTASILPSLRVLLNGQLYIYELCGFLRGPRLSDDSSETVARPGETLGYPLWALCVYATALTIRRRTRGRRPLC